MFHVTNSMCFGSSAAVFAFNRISRSLRFLLCKELLVPSSVFYDDLPLLSPEESADEADERASELLDLLGWRHAKTGPSRTTPIRQWPFCRTSALASQCRLSQMELGEIAKPGSPQACVRPTCCLAQSGKTSGHPDPFGRETSDNFH